MKKIAAIVLALMLVLSMAVIGVSAVTDSVSFGSGTGTLNVYKNKTVTTDDPTGLEGAGFTAYKVMSFNGTAPNQYFSFVGPYATNAAVTAYATAHLTPVNGQTNQYVTYGDTDDLEGIISTLEGIANTTTASAEATTNDTGKATFTNLEKGVYLVKETTVPEGYSASSQSFLVAILEDNQVVNAFPKNMKMEIDKNILNDTQYTAALSAPAANAGSDAANYSIGDNVNYQIQSQVPNYDNREIDQMTDKNVNIVKITDTLSNGLTFSDANLTAMKVFAGENDITAVVTKTRTDDQHFTVEIPLTAVYDKASNKNYLGQNLYVVYQATLNANAVVTTGNINEAKLEYKNSPDDSAYDPDPVNIPDEKKPKAYIYQMELKKLLDGEVVTGDPSVANLSFVLKQGDNFVSATGTNGNYTVTSDHALEAAKTEFKLNTTTGTLVIKGLSAGTYTLTETGTVQGYTTLQSPLVIVVTDNGDGKVTATVNGSAVTTEQEDVANPAYIASPTQEDIDGGYDVNTSATIKQDTGRFSFEINNPKSQFDLPTTGGYGILIFTLSGAVVLAAAIIIFIVARKKKETK